MDEGFYIEFSAVNLLRQGILTHLVFLGGEFFRIHKGYPPVLFGIQAFVDFHGFFDVSRLHDQRQLVPCQITFYGISPFFILDIKQIGENTNRDIFAGFLVKLSLNLASGILQLPGIGFAAQHDFHEILLDEIRFLLKGLSFRCRLLMLLFQIGFHFLQAFFQPFQLLAGNGSLPEFIHIPYGLVGYILFLFPSFQIVGESLPFPLTSFQQSQVFFQASLLGFQLRISAADELAVDFFMLGSIISPCGNQVFQALLLGQKILFPFPGPGLQLADDFRQLQDSELVQAVAKTPCSLPALHKPAELIPDSCQLPDFRLRLFNLPAHPPVKNHAFLHILNMDILLHTDIFLHELFQPDIHPERDSAFEKPGELLHIQAPQIDIIQIPAEPFVIGGIKPFLTGQVFLQVIFKLSDRHGASGGPVTIFRNSSFMPEEQAADFIGGGVHIKNHTHTFLFPASCLFQFQRDGGGKIMVSFVFRLVVFPDIDHASQVFQQAPVRIIRGGFIKEAPSVRIGIQDDLNGIDNGGLSASGMTGKKIDAFI